MQSLHKSVSMVGSPSFLKGCAMLTKARNLSFSFFVFFLADTCFAQESGRILSKLIDLLYVFIPMLLVVGIFFILEWRRKRNLKLNKLMGETECEDQK